MENSRKSACDLVERVADALMPVVPVGSSLVLGLSGGVDSVVLLHILRQLASRCSWRLSALHIHHGISSHADAWAAFCDALCVRHEIPFKIERVDIEPLREHGIESAARQLRHAALNCQPADFIALAHHQDDQAETLLLQLLRGAGVRGASAMPFLRMRSGLPSQVRPLLNVTRSELLGYAKQHSLEWVEDESNADDSYPRNFMRHRVLPLLGQRFPGYRTTLARSARHFAEAGELLDQLAQQDAQGALHNGSLDVARLKTLGLIRAKNLLRYYLHGLGSPMPQAVQLDQMLHQLFGACRDAAVLLTFGDWQLRRYQGRAYAFPSPPKIDVELCVQWQGEGALDIPELGGVLYFDVTLGQGISLKKLQQGMVTVRLRRGSEHFRPDGNRPTRTLKNLLQEQGMPPWQREMLPLLFCNETLIAIPSIGVACDYQTLQGEAGVVLRWCAIA